MTNPQRRGLATHAIMSVDHISTPIWRCGPCSRASLFPSGALPFVMPAVAGISRCLIRDLSPLLLELPRSVSARKLPPHRRRRRVLDLEPMVGPLGDVARSAPLAHNPLAAEFVGVPRTRSALDHGIRGLGHNARPAAGEEAGQFALARLDRLPPESRPSISIRSKATNVARSPSSAIMLERAM